MRTDGGSAFIDKGFQSFCQAIGMTHNATVAYHPEAHGQVEVQNRETMRHFKALLQTCSNTDQHNWDKSAPIIANILNNKVHAQTGYSPFNLIFGSEHALRHSSNDLKDLDTSDAGEYLKRLDRALKQAHKYAEETQDYLTIANYDKYPAADEQFKVGDFILLPNSIADLKKLSLKFQGPFKIESQTDSKDIFRVRDIVQDKFRYAHASTFIKFPYEATEEDLRAIAALDYGEYNFTILSHQGDPTLRSSIFVQVEWHDETKSVSWLPIARCTHCDSVRDYFANMKGFENICSTPDYTPKFSKRQAVQNRQLGDFNIER